MPCSPRMVKCSIRCVHWQVVNAYREERERQLSQAEEEALGYKTELDALRPDLITFQRWLKAKPYPPKEES